MVLLKIKIPHKLPTKKPSNSPKGTCKGTLKVNFFKYIYLFEKWNLKFLVLHVTCLIFSQKNDILRICVEENMVKKLENWSHCIRIQQKKHIQKRTGTAKRRASMSKPIKISSNEILTTICAMLLDRLAQVQGGYGEHKWNIVYVQQTVPRFYNDNFSSISYTLPHSENWFRQFHCYFVNNFTTAFVTFTSFIDNCGFLALFRSW